MHLKLWVVSLGLVAAFAFGVGCNCGGNSGETHQDAGPDAPIPQFDGGKDQGPEQDDAGPTCGTFTAPNGCGFELSSCTVAAVNSDECGGDIDCVDAGLFGLVCLKTCTCTAECGFSTICLPSKTTDYVSAATATQIIGSARGHCFYSFCGGEGDDTSPFGNGNFFGACDMGADAFIKPGKVDTLPGTCFPLSTDVQEGYVPMGLCQEAGSKPRGGTCSFSTNECFERTTFDACAVGTTCIGRQGDETGTCAKLCDPNATGFNPAVAGDCAADNQVTHDQFCQDSSDYQSGDCVVSDGGVVDYKTPTSYNYVGFCVDTQGCDVLAAANTCANVTSDGGVPMHSCEPTSAVDSYGLCGTGGDVGLGGTCNNTLLCQPGLVCITVGTATNGACEKYCGLGPNVAKMPCGTGEVCDKILYGSDSSAECWDDPWTLGFGICKPDTRQDGGAEDGGLEDGGLEDGAPDA